MIVIVQYRVYTAHSAQEVYVTHDIMYTKYAECTVCILCSVHTYVLKVVYIRTYKRNVLYTEYTECTVSIVCSACTQCAVWAGCSVDSTDYYIYYTSVLLVLTHVSVYGKHMYTNSSIV